MLKLTEINKSYKVGEEKQQILKNINITFRSKEFVSILGASGSGKSTLLNCIGGLDVYDSGDLTIDGVSTKKYNSHDWDQYRNNKLGFIFQNYNLIMHQSVLANVELSLTLAGISKVERRKKAIDALTQVGLKDHIWKLPNQLSGGEMQRVSIARALVNNPDIILADEPTGALDSKTSVQIMDLLKEISKDKLIIMVTHNPELAKIYSTRIIELKDGTIINDSNEYKGKDEKKEIKMYKKTSMSLKTSLGLSFKNLLNKKGRTILTAIAGSIGITGIALVLSLSNGLKSYIADIQTNSVSDYAISIEKVKYNLFGLISDLVKEKPKAKAGNIVSYDDILQQINYKVSDTYKENNTTEFKKYIETNKEKFEKLTADIKYQYDIDIQMFSKVNNKYEKVMPINFSNNIPDNAISVTSTQANIFNELSGNEKSLKNSYEVVAGKMPTQYNEIALIINKDAIVPDSLLYALNIKNRTNLMELINNNQTVNNTDISYDEILNIKYKLINKVDTFKLEKNIVVDCSNNINYMNKIINKGIDVRIVGILKTENTFANSLGYTTALKDYLVSQAEKSEIALFQIKNPTINIFTGKKFDKIENTYENNLQKLGIALADTPKAIDLYPKSKKDKAEIIKLIDEYNNQQTDKNLKIEYTDQIELSIEIIQKTINIVSYAIIAFVAISLIVSSIMIAIITYISVLERTKEIGILRAIGASKKDITRVFRAETIIEGFISGSLGVIGTLLINLIINIVIKLLLEIDKLAVLSLTNMIILIILSIILTVIAGIIPSNMASKKNPVEALRSE